MVYNEALTGIPTSNIAKCRAWSERDEMGSLMAEGERNTPPFSIVPRSDIVPARFRRGWKGLSGPRLGLRVITVNDRPRRRWDLRAKDGVVSSDLVARLTQE